MILFPRNSCYFVFGIRQVTKRNHRGNFLLEIETYFVIFWLISPDSGCLASKDTRKVLFQSHIISKILQPDSSSIIVIHNVLKALMMIVMIRKWYYVRSASGNSRLSTMIMLDILDIDQHHQSASCSKCYHADCQDKT